MPTVLDMSRLIEPLGLLHGEEAASACAAGLALPLMGGPAAFTLCVLHGDGERRIVPATACPAGWSETLARVTRAPSPAGLPPGPLVMGILNVTPDSFSDGGRHGDAAQAVAAARRMAADGAAIIDIGGESTRPTADPVSPGEEQRRILPVIEALCAHAPRPLLSVDTRHAATMRAALSAGADIINDVTALSHDPAARAAVASLRAPVVLMHMRGTPQTMATLTDYDDVAVDMVRELGASLSAAIAAGIDLARIVVDPGIGFAKDTAQNLELLRRLPILANLGCRVLLGVSRKGFIGRVTGAEVPTERLAGSLVSALPALALPGSILRVHDVAETVQAVRLWSHLWQAPGVWPAKGP